MATTRQKKASTHNGSREEERTQDSMNESFNESLNESYQAWSGFYQRMAEEGLTFFQKNMEAAQQMMPGMLGMSGMPGMGTSGMSGMPGMQGFAAPDLYRQWTEAFHEMVNAWETEGGTMNPEIYQKMYRIWLEMCSKSAETFMRTPEFVQASGKNLEAFSDAKARMGEMIEEYWGLLHLPSTHDMRELYHKHYLQERKLDEMDRKLDEILSHLKTSRNSEKI